MEQTTSEGKTVLDVCCGSRMMWFDRQHPKVIYGDRRQESVTVTDNSRGNKTDIITRHIEPIFKPGTRLAIIARTPDNPDADVLVTNDDLDGLAALIERSRGRAEVDLSPAGQDGGGE